MLSLLRPALVLTGVMTVVTGLAYPLAVTGLAETLFPRQAGGSLVHDNGTVIGSDLIGQTFTRPGYFQGRPSAAGTGYDAANSSGSNLGPSSRPLVDAVAERVNTLRAANPDAPAQVPVDLVTASASGLDPHITPAAALWQVPRIARERRLPAPALRDLIHEMTEGRDLGLLGEPRVNVLRLNRALDARWPLSS
ncbi:potassium-transporting ATPase subunit KdpC [Novispirillum itersonii]|uniref:potassium-transporting ATPase subunit KdpC n=1 Tax=Novispirillum itersonii TaxID=189 RepID=UPI00036B9896|nr:potassium-transporting ATPase subunit KdpC [Novispirillum itersonii]